MRKTNFITLLILFAVILWTGFAFRNSMQTAKISGTWSKSVLAWIQFHIPSLIFLTDHILRKIAHFFEYSILGSLSAMLWYRFFKSQYTRISFFLLFTVPIPFIDECIQLMTDGRSGQLKDVILDCSGLFFGAVITVLAITAFKSIYRHIAEGKNNAK